MDLSVVVVNWHGGSHLRRLLESLQPLAGELRDVVVVDNSAQAAGLVGPLPPPVRQEVPARNLGFAGGANRGVELVDGAFVLLLNPDVCIFPDSIRKLYRTIHELSDAAIICGPLVGPDGQSQSFQFRPLPTPGRLLREVLIPGTERARAQAARGTRTHALVEEVDQPAAAYWMIRKSAWTDLGGMDEQFFPAWFEDVDFCRRARSAGWKFYCRLDSPAQHHGGASLERLGWPAFYRHYYRNLLRYLRKHHPAAYPWLWLPVKVGGTARILGSKLAG